MDNDTFPHFANLTDGGSRLAHRYLYEKHYLSLQKKRSFPLKISSVNMTKSARNCGFGHIY